MDAVTRNKRQWGRFYLRTWRRLIRDDFVNSHKYKIWWTRKKSSPRWRTGSRFSATTWNNWIPSFDGMTKKSVFGLFTRSSTVWCLHFPIAADRSARRLITTSCGRLSKLHTYFPIFENPSALNKNPIYSIRLVHTALSIMELQRRPELRIFQCNH